jgi:hypothetical protein
MMRNVNILPEGYHRRRGIMSIIIGAIKSRIVKIDHHHLGLHFKTEDIGLLWSFNML